MSNERVAIPKETVAHSICAQIRQCHPFPIENEKNRNNTHCDQRSMAESSLEMRPLLCCWMIMQCMMFHLAPSRRLQLVLAIMCSRCC